MTHAPIGIAVSARAALLAALLATATTCAARGEEQACLLLPLHASASSISIDAGEATTAAGGLTWLPQGDPAPLPTGSVATLVAHFGGLPVLDAHARLHRDAGGRERWLVLPRGLPDRPAPGSAWRMSAEEVRDRIGGAKDAAIERVYLAEHDGLRAAYQLLVRGPDPRTERLVVIDAAGGERIEVRALGRPLVQTGEGLIFDPNPIAASGDRGLTGGDDVDPWRVIAELPELDGSGLLRGTWADIESPLARAFNPDLRFHYSSRDLHFEEVMAYCHITRARQRLIAWGFPGLNARRQAVSVHTVGQDASWYSTIEKRIYLGDDGIDDAEDADVILHEYGHAVYDQAVGAVAGGDTPALSEGFADYFAATLTGDACIGDWEGVCEPTGCLRDLALHRHYPDDLTGRPHEDGLLWSSLLWRLRGVLEIETADRLAVLALYFQTPRSRFADAVQGLLAAATDLDPTGELQARVEEALGERGFLPRAGRLTLAPGEQADLPLGFAFRGPGMAAVWSDTLRILADGRCLLAGAAPGGQGHAADAAVLAPLVLDPGAAGAGERLDVAWQSAGGTTALELRYFSGGRLVRRAEVRVEAAGALELSWFGEGDREPLPGLVGWFPRGEAAPARWLTPDELLRAATVQIEAGAGVGVRLAAATFELAGARIRLHPDGAGGTRVELAALPWPAPASAGQLSVTPSPARTTDQVLFRVEREASYAARLLDGSGRCLGLLPLGRLAPGVHEIALADLTQGPPAVSPGIYFLRLDSAVDTRTARLLLLR